MTAVVELLLQAEAAAPDLLIVAGEHSGDQHAAVMVKELLKLKPGLRICAVGGPALQQAGCHLLLDLLPHAVVGFFEVLKHYGYFKALFQALLQWIEKYRPKYICLVDYPGFNLRLAQALYQKGYSVKGGGQTPVYYYISPQVWAWKAKRRFQMAQWIDQLAVILPFEVDYFKDTALPTAFVGHPFVSPQAVPTVAYDPQGPILLLPGSRKAPARYILPVLLEAFAKYRLHYKAEHKRAVIIVPNNQLQKIVEAIIDQTAPSVKDDICIQNSNTLVSASAALTTSGTMSLKCALAGIPGAIVYKCSVLTYYLARMLVKVPYLGICNLLLNTTMYPEFIQPNAQPSLLAKEIDACLHDKERIEATQAQAQQLKVILNVSCTYTSGQWLASLC